MLLFTMVLLMLPLYLYGYIDPGTGSYLIQLLIAGLVGGLYTIKLYWEHIKKFFISRSKRK